MRFLARLTGEAGVRRVLVIAGDRGRRPAEFRGAIEVDRWRRAAASRHHRRSASPAIPTAIRASRSRSSTARSPTRSRPRSRPGWRSISSPSSASTPQPILRWIGRLRGFGIEHPVRIGLAGPTNLATLLRYARRCGVRASAQGLARQAGLMRHLFGDVGARRAGAGAGEARADGQFGDVAPHFFSFGGLAWTARWAERGGAAPDRARRRARVPGRAAAVSVATR